MRPKNDKKSYLFFYSCKNQILKKKNVPYIQYADLDRIYLSDNEWIFVLNQILGYEIEEIKEFKENMDMKI